MIGRSRPSIIPGHGPPCPYISGRCPLSFRPLSSCPPYWLLPTTPYAKPPATAITSSQEYVRFTRAEGRQRDSVNLSASGTACLPLEGRHTAISSRTIGKAIKGIVGRSEASPLPPEALRHLPRTSLVTERYCKSQYKNQFEVPPVSGDLELDSRLWNDFIACWEVFP